MGRGGNVVLILESLSKDVFLYICLDANKFVLLRFFSLMKRIYPRVSNKPLPNNAKGPLPVDVRRSTTLLLKLPIMNSWIVFVQPHWSAYNRRIVSIAPPKKRNQYDIIDLKRTKYLIKCLNRERHKLQKGMSVDQLWHHWCKETCQTR